MRLSRRGLWKRLTSLFAFSCARQLRHLSFTNSNSPLIRSHIEAEAGWASTMRDSVKKKTVCALRYFAGGDPQDLKLIYGMSKAQVMLCVWRTVDAINLCLDNINFPIDDVAALQELEADFRALWKNEVTRELTRDVTCDRM